MDSIEIEVCGRFVIDGSGISHTCEKAKGHFGAHRHTWIDNKGIRQLGLSWTHENWQGYPVWPETKGAIDVTRSEKGVRS